MTLRVSVDFGTSSTCTVVSLDAADGKAGQAGQATDPEPQVVVIDGQPIVPSAVFAAPDGTLFVGHEAERQAAVDPSRFEPHPKRRIDEGELLLGSTVLTVVEVIRAVLQRVVGEARRYAGGASVDQLVLTHPADWGVPRTQQLRQAASGLARELVLVPEPVAAAMFHSASHGFPEGAALAVLDMGGGTIDASVVRKQGGGFQTLATHGDPNFGGADIDQALLDHVGGIVSRTDPDAWYRLVAGRDMADRRRRRMLRQDVRGAKETLSRHAYTDVPMPPPFSDAHVTRTNLERLVGASLSRAVDLVSVVLREGGVPRPQLTGVFLVGGSSRIPLVSRLIHERLGVVPTTLDQPETVVARGALRAARLDVERSVGAAVPGGWAGVPAQPGRTPTPAGPRSGVPVPATAGLIGMPVSGPGAAAPGPGSGPGLGPPGRPLAGPALTPVRTPVPTPAAQDDDSLSRASTIVIGGSDPTRRTLSALTRRARKQWRLTAGVGAVALAGLVIALMLTDGNSPGDNAPGSVPAAAQAVPRHIAQYDYSFDYPADWRQSGGDPKQWQTLISAPAPLNGRIAVQEGTLDYDADANRQRAIDELHQEFDQRAKAGQPFTGFNGNASFAGKERLVYYREQQPNGPVDWYAIHKGQKRVFVGCQYDPAARTTVTQSCQQIVASLVIR